MTGLGVLLDGSILSVFGRCEEPEAGRQTGSWVAGTGTRAAWDGCLTQGMTGGGGGGQPGDTLTTGMGVLWEERLTVRMASGGHAQWVGRIVGSRAKIWAFPTCDVVVRLLRRAG